MQKWEYTTLEFGRGLLHEGGTLINIMRDFGLSRGPKTKDVLNDMGQQGWEVAGVSGDFSLLSVILKRPIA